MPKLIEISTKPVRGNFSKHVPYSSILKSKCKKRIKNTFGYFSSLITYLKFRRANSLYITFVVLFALKAFICVCVSQDV